MTERVYSKPENIDEKQWLIEIGEDATAAYAAMRKAEDEWLKSCEDAGCHVDDIGRRRWLVQVTQTNNLPSFSEVAATRIAYAEIAASLAAEQGKRPTVGSRTTELPQWVNGTYVGEEPPPPVTRIRIREQAAYRGGALKINDAIECLTNRFGVVSDQRDNANKKYKHENVLALDQKLTEIESDLKVLKRFLGKNVFARAKSGSALKINVKREAEPSFTVSMPAVLLVPVIECLEVEQAPTRAPRIGTPVTLENLNYFDVFSGLEVH